MREDNKIVNGLWIGEYLSNIELLTMRTFMEHGHTFRLWVYDTIKTPLPEGVEVMDANIIIPKEKVFRYKHTNHFGHGKGSVSGFSDIFRYKLLYDMGGWWMDMDIACIKPLDMEEPYVFRNHHSLPVVGNAMKCPKGSDLMLHCYQQASKEVTEENRDWHLPIQILNDQIAAHGLLDYVRPHISNNDRWDDLKRFVLKKKAIPENYYFIHWMNEEWRSRGLDKNHVKPWSTLGQMMIDRHMMPAYYSMWELLQDEFRYSWFVKHIPWLKEEAKSLNVH